MKEKSKRKFVIKDKKKFIIGLIKIILGLLMLAAFIIIGLYSS
ncbi:MAG TPA: hypothetical protein PLX66_01740 [Bacilli bacterium]|nr:hypothetical protein [Bacilli bacterium]